MDGNNPPQAPEFANGWGRVPGYMPPGPHILPRTNLARWSVGGSDRAPGIDVREVNRYPVLTTITLNVTASSLILQQPDTSRIWLTIRCDAASPGSLLVAFGVNASAATAAFTIVAGGVLLLDYCVPQNDVYIAGSAANSLGVLTYANSPL